MENKLEYHTVVLAALLHDNGKLWQRATSPILDRKQHPEFSAEFVSAFSALFSRAADSELLKMLVQHHHESSKSFPSSLLVAGIPDPHARALATIISQADHFSASERGEVAEYGQPFKLTPLASVMEQVRIPEESSKKENSSAPGLRFHARALSGTDDKLFGGIFPDNIEYATDEINKLLEYFGPKFRDWAEKAGTPDFDVLLTHLLHFLYKYTWCVPSDTQTAIPDISLYDHLRVTAAIAACLYLYHKEKDSLMEEAIKASGQERFYLVAGDVSGIQRYIFDIANIGAGSVARRLRSRSLFVQLVTESCAMKILKDFDLPVSNILMSAGGNFHLLVPKLAGTESLLAKANQEIDQWFLQELNGELALNLACQDLDKDGFGASKEGKEAFGGVLRGVNDRLAQVKQKRFSSLWVNDGKWQKDRFVANQDFKGGDACHACHKFPLNNPNEENPEERLCGHCILDNNTGKVLPDKHIVAFFGVKGTEDKKDAVPLPYGSALLIKDAIPPNMVPHMAVKLNSTDLTGLSAFPAQSKFIANYIPKVVDDADKQRLTEIASKNHITDIPDVGQPVTFELLAAQAEGRHYLGFLKMDADRMGEVMVFGLKREKLESGRDTISRLATLSRQVEWFFSGWVQHLLETEFKNCYTVFSGGDDLFVVGTWNEILQLADRIETDYYEYTGNDQLTISAGIVIAGDSYPISRAAEDDEEAVEKSKKAGRDSITVLGHTLKWDDWQTIKGEWEKLSKEKISSAFLYGLLQYGRMWKQYKSGDTLGLRFQPLLAYNVGRNLSERDSPALYKWAQGIISLKCEDMKQKQVILDNLGLLAQLLILGKKGVANDAE